MSVPMTEEEKDLLCTVFSTQLQQQYIREGKLLEDQELTLRQMRAVVEWLQKKYPSHSFRLTAIEWKTPLKATIDYAFTADGGETVYYVTTPGMASAEFKESFYAALLAEPCAERMERLLAERGLPLVGAKIDFQGLAGDEVTELTSAEELLAMGEQVFRRTTVFLSGDEAVVRDAQDAVETLGLVGGYWLFASERFRPGMSTEACWEIKREGGDDVYSASFFLG